ncbi:MAG: DUF2953 domain-containing protein [Clostridia bacterium]|nr:DUF2953 domain-containing protein [Clostridia bacterium]
MIYLWLILLLVLGLITALLLAPLKITVEYSNSKLNFTFRCMFFKITISERNLKRKKGKTDKGADAQKAVLTNSVQGNSVLGRIKIFKEGYTHFSKVILEVLSHVQNHAEFSGIYLRVRYGTGDAAITGMIYGAIWSIVGSIYSLLCRFFKVDFPKIELEPVFGGKALEIEAEGIIRTRLVHIITAAYRSMKIYLQHKKEKGAD